MNLKIKGINKLFKKKTMKTTEIDIKGLTFPIEYLT